MADTELNRNKPDKQIAYLSTFPPTNCGIASFTKDLVSSINRSSACNSNASIIEIVDKRQENKVRPQVKWAIDYNTISDYVEAAECINKSDVCLVNVQHEFALFGGRYGNYIIDFYNHLRKPIVTTCHTILSDYPSEQLRVFREILDRSQSVVVTTPTATKLLQKQGLLSSKVVVIPHGCPNIPFVEPKEAKMALGFEDRLLVSTFGLITRSKGIEFVIESLPLVIEQAPNILYLVMGRTHSHALDLEKEAYRNELLEQVSRLKLQGHVQFIDRYLSRSELIRYLQATDIYVTAYTSPNQISSGALTWALGAGKATISTPYFYAQDTLADGRGILCEFNNPTSIANAIHKYLDESYRSSVEKEAYRYSRQFLWPKVAKRYCELFQATLQEAGYQA